MRQTLFKSSGSVSLFTLIWQPPISISNVCSLCPDPICSQPTGVLSSVFTAQHYPEASSLNKEIVLVWCAKKSYEAQANQCTRASILRQLAIHMENSGARAYVLPKGYYPKEEQYVPYIYTEKELQRFFQQTDRCYYFTECPYRHLIMPIFFRMHYACGLRSSEARLLKYGDVDLEAGILTINHAKKDNKRLVPIPDSLTQSCRHYISGIPMFPKESDWFFPGLDGKPMTIGNVYHNFRRFLWKAGIFHGGRGKGPRVQDFRYAYACHCLKKWVLQGKDLTTYLLVPKTYLGHYSFEETAGRSQPYLYPGLSWTQEHKVH